MSSRPFESPPPYRPDEYKPSLYAPSQDMYGGKMPSQPAYSYYAEDEIQHFYKWSSPPGVIKIMAILIVVMCVGIFACVASTLPWDLDISGNSMGYGMGYSGGYSGAYNGYGFGTSQMGYGFGYGGNYTDPRAAKGFILAMAAFCFICGMVIFVMTTTRTDMSTTRRFYLIVMIVSGILGGLIFIATIVYIMAVNPVAQASGSAFYNQIVSLCSQFYSPVTTGVFVNQYLYHYCVVEPQEAIAIVLGFLIVVAFAIIIFFAVKTRRKINNYGKQNILWKKDKTAEEGDPNVEEWVKNVTSDPEQVPAMSEYNEKVNGSIMEHRSVNGLQAYSEHSFRSHQIQEEVYPVKNESGYSPNVYSSSSEASKKAPRKKRPGRPRKSPNDYDTDYTTGGESAEELEDDDWESEYPPITSDQQRQEYKREFDANLQEYKKLQAELEDVSKSLAQLDQELDEHPEGSQSYKAIADEYNRLKDIKSSFDYKNKRKHCKQLKTKLNHIKNMVSDYDRSK
ncbi:occludin [Hyla sarda]|uniref:occludin n=1 Tax=Hyla sarda TaxID=327740 RepID=UPI0024C35AAE|nr:occludin [Hyla sarda]XP_056395547.1 occludin [Hyla sarda]XP_056395556.1 occludin [Hyla sarda]XP_056395561.1 occludin [Hyla sarda]XP_056395566.1 occludin [Hyla sarda]